MTKLFGVYCTDQVARDGSRLTVSALDDMIWMGSDGGRPLGVAHDWHRFIGWNMITGLYMSHECSYVVGNSYLPDTKEEYEDLAKRRKAFWMGMMSEHLEKYLQPFNNALDSLSLLSKQGRWHYNGLALYGYDGVLYKAFPQLKDLEDDGLIKLEDLFRLFDYKGQGVFACKKNNMAVVLHPFFRRSQSIFNNFNFGFLDKLFDVYASGNHTVKVRLDTDNIGFAPSYLPCHEYEYWYGPQYNDDIASIPEGVCKYNNEEADKCYNNVDFTEFVWQKKDDCTRYQFEMEEVVDREAPTLGGDTYACRYLHAFYDFSTGEFNHFDGAIRTYDFEQMVDRTTQNITQFGHRAEYTKIFRIDGHISLDLWKGLISQYLCSNRSVYEYFGIEYPFSQKAISSNKKDLQYYVPYILNKGDGVRLCVSYGERYDIQEKWTFTDFDEIELSDGICKVIEFPAVEVVKVLKRVGAAISLPTEQKLMVIEDYNNNIPAICHADGEDLAERIKLTLSGIRLLMEQYVKNDFDDIFTFAIAWNIERRGVSVNFMGHVSDLSEWLNSFDTIPIDRANLKKWMDAQNSYIHHNGMDSRNPISDRHIQSDGKLFFKRRPVLKDIQMSNIQQDKSIGYTATIKVQQEDEILSNLLQENKIFFAPAMFVKSAKVQKSDEDYLTVDKSAVFKECEYMIDPQMLGFFWTTKPRSMCIG